MDLLDSGYGSNLIINYDTFMAICELKTVLLLVKLIVVTVI